MADDVIGLGFEPYIVDSAYREVDDFSRYMEGRLGKTINEIDGDFVKLAKNRMVEFVKYEDRIDAIAYTLTKGGKISKSKNNLPFLLGANFSPEEIKKIQSMSNQEFSQVKHIATLSRRRNELAEARAKKEADKKAASDLARKRGAQFSDIMRENLWGNNLKAYELSQKKSELKRLQGEYSLVSEKDTAKAKELEESITKTRKEISRLQRELKPTAMGKFFNFFKRMGMSRVLFSTWTRIISDMSASIQNLSNISPEYNKMFSEINSDISKISASIVSVIAPLLSIAQPIISFIANAIANIASGLSKVTSVLSGQNKYLKVNKEYYKDINAEANKLSFDKFEALSGNATQELLVEEEMSSDEMVGIIGYLTTIGALLTAFGTYKIMKWIQDDGVKKLTDGLGKVGKKIDDISNAAVVAGAAFAFVTTIFNLINVINNWKSESLITKITAITAAVAGLAAVIFSILAATGVGSKRVMKGISIGLTAGATLLAGVSAMRFADGGIPSKGSLFIAGEAGAELVHTMPSGNTGVTNVEQFTQAMINANYQSSGLFQSLIEAALYNCSSLFETNIDGASIARSKTFKNEINRTNSGLNLK